MAIISRSVHENEQWKMFDTNIVSEYQRGNLEIRERFLAVPPDVRAVAVFTVDEQLTGWYTQVRRAKSAEAVIYAYERLAETVEFYANLRILRYDAAAHVRFLELSALKLGVAKPDLRIAAVALAHDARVVTRNVRDFARIPDLSVADWDETDAAA